MSRKLTTLSILTVVSLLGFALEADAPVTASSPATVTTSHQSGMILNIDPTTGGLVEKAVSPAHQVAVSDELANSFSTSDEGLQAIPNPGKAGGTLVRLEGRFQNAVVATVDANGKLVAPCVSGLNPADASASKK